MANITRNFIAGKMNKVVDERLIPDGEYIDALNIRMGSTENAEIGVMENTKGNVKLTTIKYIDGTPLSSSAKCIGAIDDSANEIIYWFIHDSAFPVGATGKLDMIVSFNALTEILTYHVVSIDDGNGVNTTLNFNDQYLITGVDIIDNLIFFTDDYNPPRFINRKKNYADPVANIDQFSAESILVIKKPPVASPGIQLLTTGNQENFLEDRFICFAYRYRYDDGEYSATSQWSAPAFQPNPFEFSINSFLNEGMINLNNTAVITYNTGGPLVKGIDLLFKEAQSNVIKVIEKLSKAELGLADNTNYTYTFSNSKIFTILPESELLRLYDNVPLLAKAQTIMGNRLMYGNYVEGYDVVDEDGNPVKLEYQANLVSELIDTTSISDSTSSGNYLFGSTQPIPNSVVSIDLSGVDLVEGASITLQITISHNTFAGDTPFPTETSENISATFSFTLPTSYASVYAMATSIAFQDAVGSVANIQTVANSCSGTTFTDQINCALPNNLDALIKYQSGISTSGQPIGIVTSPASSSIGFQMPAMRYVNNTTTPTVNVYEYYSVVFAEAFYQKINSPRSLHSNRGYEIGIVYMDEFNRSTTALVSPNNTVHVPCSASDTKNSIQVTIPTTQKPPYWATRYKFVIKPDEENYETIYSSIFFNDPLSNNAYFLLEGENARKVEQGDRLIVKADTSGPTQSCVYATVLEKEAKAEGFITIPSELDPNVDIPVPSGVYMKINPNSFSVVQDELSIIAPGTVQVDQNNAGQYPILPYLMNLQRTAGYDPLNPTWEYQDYTVPAGSRIKLNLTFKRLGTGDGGNACEKRIYTLEKLLISSANYDNMQDWFNGDNVAQVLNDGVQDVGGNNCEVGNEYIATLASGPNDIPTDLCTNYFRFYRDTTTNKLSLLMTGTVRCGGVLSAEKRRSTIIANIEVFRAETTLIFETEPSDALPDVFFENDLSLPIVNGFHTGNVQNQTASVPAIVDTEFFNCFCFGNGAESYKIRDSIVGRSFNLGNRVTSVSAQDYKRVDRFADITYSGMYNFESNVNKLNEFNLGLLNYKYLEVSFGPIYRMDGRETDVLTLQEDKISYVLAGKNLLSDSTGGGAISSVPEVLGTQIARVEKYGISFNPESYVQWGYYRYFTDVKRGAVLQLVGNSYSTDQLRVVSEQGMRTWFRDNFIENFNTQKLGGFDPYLNEYVLTTNTEELPQPQECLACGVSQVLNIAAGDVVTYCVDLGATIGDATILYSVDALSTSEFEVDVNYNGNVESSGIVSASGSLLFSKDTNSVNIATIGITAIGPIEITITPSCPISEELNVVNVCLTTAAEAGKFIHNEYRYTDGDYTSPLQSNLVTFAAGVSPIVSQYSIVSGVVGTGGFPPAGATMEIITHKFGFDTFDFDPSSDSFRYYRSNTLYGNNPGDIAALLAASTEATPITGSGVYHSSTFTVPSVGDYLYLIWDYRNSLPLSLCYSDIDQEDACCGCLPQYIVLCYANTTASDSCCNCPTSAGYYLGGSSTFASATGVFTDVGLTVAAPNGYYSFGGLVRQQVSGVLQAQQSCPNCGFEEQLCYSNIDEWNACCGCNAPITPLCYSNTSALDSCCECVAPTNYYVNAVSFLSATAVYTNSGLSTLAPDGYYSESGIVRQQVSGVLQVQSSCLGCGTLEQLCYSNTSALDSCCNCPTQNNYYLDGASFALSTAVYTDVNLTTLAADGYYSLNGNVRQQTLGVLQAQSSCPGCGMAETLCYSNIDEWNACCGCNAPVTQLCYSNASALDSCCNCPTQGNYYLNGASFAVATAVYTNSSLTTLAPDGYYSEGGVVRQQVSGVLQTQSSCPGCGVSVSLCYSNVDAFDSCCGCVPL